MSAQAAPHATITLPEILALGSQHKPWAFVPVARQALPQTAFDPELWFLLARNLADLGLGTLAAEELDALLTKRPQAERLPRVTQLRATIADLPDDRVSATKRRANAERALHALAERGLDLSADFARWCESLADTEAFRASDGNIVRRTGKALTHFGDQIGAARHIGSEHIAKAAQSPAPFLIEGLDPPWLLIELDQRTPQLASGYQPGIRVVQQDPIEFFDGCALADISSILRQKRVECFIGQDAGEMLAQSLSRDAGTPIAGPYMPLRSLRTPCTPAVSEIVRHELEKQNTAHADHLARVHARDASRDEAYWRQRITDAIAGRADPLRIVIATCRFTTVLGEMGSDLAESLRKLGCEVWLLTEPSGHRRLSPLGYSKVLDEFDPDLILAPNYTRRDLEKVITGHENAPPESRVLPAGVPFVVWVQDSMPHLLTTAAGASIGPLDLAMGYVSREMINDFGYPREAVLPAPLVASTTKFDASRIDPDLARSFACDVAMMTHHSETPEALRDRLLQELAGSSAVRQQMASIVPALDEIARDPCAQPGIYAAVRSLFESQRDLDHESREMLIQNFAMRYIDRRMRHEVAHWCREICERRGWTFRLFGKGWAQHPELGRFASPSLEHGDALAAAYHAAGLTIHTSAFSPMHQRLIECALAGGVPIFRRTVESDRLATQYAFIRILRDQGAKALERTVPDDGMGTVVWFDWLSSLDAVHCTKYRQRLGHQIDDRLAIRDPATDPRITQSAPIMPEADASWLLGGPDDSSFASADELETLIEHAHSYPGWRTSKSAGIASRARSFHTHDALASRLIEAIKRRLA